MKSKVFLCVTNNVCHLNIYLATQIYNFINLNGFNFTDRSKDADIIIIVTCAVDENFEKQSLNIVNRYIKKYKKDKRIIVAGCLPKINERVSKIEDIICIGPKELEKFDDLFKPKIKISSIKANKLNKGLISRRAGPDDYYVEISKGCANNCSYCAIKKAKGGVKSKPIKNIINEFKEGLDLGYKQFVLLADDCGSYGIDINTNFAELLNSIKREAVGDFSLTIYYFEPGRLIELYPKIDKNIIKRIKYLTVPIQSTSQRILKLMNRNYSVNSVLDIIQDIRLLNPKIWLETHVINCFPSETREESFDALKLKKYFNKVAFYQYSDRNGTVAINLPDKIPKEEIEYRRNKLKKILTSME